MTNVILHKDFSRSTLAFFAAIGKQKCLQHLDIQRCSLNYGENLENITLMKDSIIENCKHMRTLVLGEKWYDKGRDQNSTEMREACVREIKEKLPSLHELRF